MADFIVSGVPGGVCAADSPSRVACLTDPDTQPVTASQFRGLPWCVREYQEAKKAGRSTIIGGPRMLRHRKGRSLV